MGHLIPPEETDMIFKDKSILKAQWVGLFILCALLGFVPQPTGANKWLLMIFGILFFLPPALLLYQGYKTKDKKLLQRMRKLSAISLISTLVLIIANMLSLLAPQAVGDTLYFLLVVASAPMVCCQYWLISLSGWAIVLWCTIVFLRDMKK